MTGPDPIDEYIDSLRRSPRLGRQVVYQNTLPGRKAEISPLEPTVSGALAKMLAGLKVSGLYSHQRNAIEALRRGGHVVVATPTASGKTMVYNIPFLEKVLARPSARAIYLFPLKALARDQLKSFREMALLLPGAPVTAAVYDGDTSAWHRKKIRTAPPSAVLTNPEMLHLSLLPFHEKWRLVFENLEMVVVDEVHTYRGVLGSHMAQIFRRLARVCGYYGSRPQFVFCSATIANPEKFCEDLVSVPVCSETRSGASAGKRHFVFINPEDSPAHTAILLLKAALHRGLRTIVYTQSRKMTELISVWAGSRSGRFRERISAYRSGFLPEERREIEHKLLTGELLAVISTSALELGIDIGDLDLCILVGYPGTVMSTWQRGGRVGRRGHASAVVLIAGEDALDQYFMRHPEEFFRKGPEAAVINPSNPDILKRHLVCAAAELPLSADIPYDPVPGMKNCISSLEASGDLLRSADGAVLYAARKQPHRQVDLRGAGARFQILDQDSRECLGEVDGFRAFRETHPGAVYLHKGISFRVETLDAGAQTVIVRPSRPVYYTRVRADKQTEILDIHEAKNLFATRILFGRLKVTDQVTGYEKIHLHGQKRITIIPLDLPPQVFETDGLWIEIPPAVQEAAENRQLHFMGGIHAMEHALIGIIPLLVLTDRNDFGGISIPYHPQVGRAAVFVYDAFPGGIGLCREAFGVSGKLLRETFKAVAACPCKNGCPACVHSPKCGSGNRPIDKSAALYLMEHMIRGDIPDDAPARISMAPENRSPADGASMPAGGSSRPAFRKECPPGHYGVLDIETQQSADEVGGWHRADRMGISCAVVFDSQKNQFIEYFEKDIPRLIQDLKRLDLVIGFNLKRFDYRVLSGYADVDFQGLPTLDLLESIHCRLGYRISLNNLAAATLGAAKSADGLQALRWWKEGRLSEIAAYCRKDVEITRDLYLRGRETGYLLFRNKAGDLVRVPADW